MDQPAGIYKAIVKVMADMNAISKGQRNTQQNYQFRGIDDIYNELHDKMADAQVFSVPQVLNRLEEIYTNNNGTRMTKIAIEVKYRFCHSDGSSIEVGPIWGEGMDSADKATNKAFSAAHKYAFLQLLCIPTKDIDEADRETPTVPQNMTKQEPQKAKNMAPIHQGQAKALFATASDKGIKTDDLKNILMGFFGIESTKELKVYQFDELMAYLRTSTLDQIGKDMIQKLAQRNGAGPESKA